MYTLSNTNIEVTILDPVADQARFGVRYCTGGYIFQVSDAHHGPLLTGPTYPESFNWFDGQGIPDAFNLRPLQEPTVTDTDALIIGIGVCDLQAKQVREFCSWDVEQTSEQIAMHTTQQWQNFALELDRTVALHNRTIRSTTRLKNTGRNPIQLCWFPHPFYPQPETPELCRFNVPVQFPDNPGYVMADSGFIARNNWPSQGGGYYQALDYQAQANLSIVQKHPTLGLVAATCSYVPTFLPIWGNRFTFSWEPFFERTIAPGQETTWWIDYDM